jgi:mono/diheme cytochrome c family protein
MNRLRFPVLAAVLLVAAVILGWSIGKLRQRTTPNVDDVRRGPLVYQAYCASCHGPEGHGDGVSATAQHPPPRDFALRPWHFEASAESIRRVTLEGIPGTAMPSFRSALGGTDLDAVVAQIQLLADQRLASAPVADEADRLLLDAGFVSLRGSRLPAMVLSDAAGIKTQMSEFKGKLLLLHFWGTSCVHCFEEIPVLTELESQQSGRLKVLHVCADEDDPVRAQQVLDRLVPGTKSYVDVTGLGLARFEIQLLPTVWLIDPNGEPIGRASGARDWHAPVLRTLLRSLASIDQVSSGAPAKPLSTLPRCCWPVGRVGLAASASPGASVLQAALGMGLISAATLILFSSWPQKRTLPISGRRRLRTKKRKRQ